MAFDSGLDDFDPAGPADSGGTMLKKAGIFHVVGEEVKEGAWDDGGRYCDITFQVLQGPEAGKKYKARINYSGKDEEGTKRIQVTNVWRAIGLGLTTVEAVQALKASGQPLNADFGSASGRQCLLEVYMPKDKEWPALAFPGIHHLSKLKSTKEEDRKKFAGVHINKQWTSTYTAEAPPSSAPAPAPAPAPAAAAPAAAPAAPASDWNF